MDAKQGQLLRLLECGGDAFVTMRELSDITGMSSRTILRHIKTLEADGPRHGFVVEKSRGRGYRVKIVNTQASNAFRRRLELFGGNAMAETVSDMAIALLLRGNIRLDDWAEQQNFSRSSISRAGSLVAALLSPFHLKPEWKAYKGLLIRGSELCLRSAAMQMIFNGRCLRDAAEILCVEAFETGTSLEAIKSSIMFPGFNPDNGTIESFIRFALLCVSRVKTQHAIDPGDIHLPESIASNVSRSIIRNLVRQRRLKWMPAFLPETESLYLAIAWEQCFSPVMELRKRYAAQHTFFDEIVKRAFLQIKKHYNVDFSANRNLSAGLAMHIAASYGRYLLGINESNLYREVMHCYPMAYCYTLEVADELSRRIRMPVFDGELGLISLHIASAMEAGRRQSRTRAVILCSHAFGTAEFLRSRLAQRYRNIVVTGIHNMEETGMHLPPADLYITTEPLTENRMHGKPLLRLSPFLHKADILALEAAVAQTETSVSIDLYCPEKGFFIVDRTAGKDTLLHGLCDTLLARKMIVPNDKDSILEREARISTEILPSVAMPHCIVAGKGFLSFTLLRSPVVWGNCKVRLVMMVFFREGDEKIKHLLTRLYRVLESEEHVDLLLRAKTYGAFIEILGNLTKGAGFSF